MGSVSGARNSDQWFCRLTRDSSILLCAVHWGLERRFEPLMHRSRALTKTTDSFKSTYKDYTTRARQKLSELASKADASKPKDSAPGKASVSALTSRFWEVDTLRGVAIVMMVIYHLLWDLWAFGVTPEIVLYAGFWKYFQRTCAGLFLILVGVSLTLSYNRAVEKRGSQGLYKKFLIRGAFVFSLGMILTLVLMAVSALTGFGLHVEFGILHLIGFSIAAAYPFLRLKWPNLILWAVFFIAGYFVQDMRVDTTWLVWLGLTPAGYDPVDFFPVIPYFGVVLLGVFLGNTLYPGGYRAFVMPDWSSIYPVRILEFLGQHSLLIYMIHQPIMLVILALFGVIRF